MQGDRSSRERIDFDALNKALLERADVLVPQWLPNGYKKGHYYYCGDFDGGEGKSANVNLRTGKWGDNGRPGDAGPDLVSLYGRVKGLSNVVAARELLQDNGWRQITVQAPAPGKGKGKGKAKQPAVEWMPICPVPDDAPPYRTQWAHYSRGVPPLHWEYRDQAGRLLLVVVRFETSTGGKDVQPITFCQGSNGQRQWRYKAPSAPRPLYGLWRLPQGYAGEVLITEGEKKADRLYDALGQAVPVLSWQGGCNTPQLSDWSPLKGCTARAWPDADAQRDKVSGELLPLDRQPGHAAMRKVQALLAELEVPAVIVDVGQPGERADGWDAADAVAEGWDADALRAFMARTVDQAQPGEPPPAADPLPAPAMDGGAGTPSAAARAQEEDPRWRDSYITSRGAVRECVPNVMLVLHRHHLWQGVLGWDEFSQRVVKRRPAPYDPERGWSAEWADVDDTRAAAWIARREGWVPSSAMVAETVTEVAMANPFHPVRDWLATLVHDGVPRLDFWLSDLLGVPDSEYVRLVSRYYLIGMCRRVIEPGCKFDYCLVLEGTQGKGKSTALSILGGEWYSDTELDLGHKDSMSYIRGKWLHEFSEMGSLARAESNRQKSFLSRQVDEFRPTYGRREIRCPRQLAFGGSTNEWAWNKDPTGGRRFWPVDVLGVGESHQVNVEGLRAIRDQLFAEAYAAALAGERYWPTPQEQRELFDPEQLSRESPDALVEMLGTWLDAPAAPNSFSMADAAVNGLKLDAKSLTRDIQTRIGHALKKLGCERMEHRNALVRFTYQRPARRAALSEPVQGTSVQKDEVPF